MIFFSQFLSNDIMKDLNFEELGFECIGKSYKKSNKKTKSCRFKCFFGATPKNVSILWEKPLKSGWFDFAPTTKLKPIHLLMWLYFLKCYNVEEVNAIFFYCDEKTFRQWSWYIVKGLANIDKKVVSF